MKLLCLTRYDQAGASSRYRTYQYLPRLRAAGFEVHESPLLDHRYIASLYGGSRPDRLRLLRSAARRLGALVAARRYDVVWIEKELFPFAPALLERLLRVLGVRVVVDYDDAIFHRYDDHRSALVRAALGRKIDRVMASATLVVAGNAYLAERARAAGAARVEILPTVIDLERYPKAPPAKAGPLTVGWVGSPSTQRYLLDVAPVLATFCRDSGARFVALGARRDFTLPGVPMEVWPWTEEGEVDALRRFDIGIMPLPDSPFERGKCGFKLIQYMGCGVPVIASPIGANHEIVVAGVTGELVTSHDEWVGALRRLGASRETRVRMGAAGRVRVEERFSLAGAAPRLITWLRELAPSRGGGGG